MKTASTTPGVAPAFRRLVLVPAARRSSDTQLRRFRLAHTTLAGRAERTAATATPSR